MEAAEFNAIFETAKQIRTDFVGDETKALRPWSALDLSIARAIREAVRNERERCARVVEKGLGKTNTTIAATIRVGTPAP